MRSHIRIQKYSFIQLKEMKIKRKKKETNCYVNRGQVEVIGTPFHLAWTYYLTALSSTYLGTFVVFGVVYLIIASIF